MLTFTVSSAGESLLANATAGTNPVLIDSIVLSGTGSSLSSVSPVTNFAGAVVASGDAGGDYVVITFDDTAAGNSYTIQQITLKSGSTTLATSEEVSITKSEGRAACFRISCQFNGANKCAFQNTNINLPYASQTRDGVIRLARTTGETHKSTTVYSALDTETKISEAIGGSDLYVPWDLNCGGYPHEGNVTVSQIRFKDFNESYDNVITLSQYYNGQDDELYLDVSTYIVGAAVSDSPSISSGSVDGSKCLVTENYISSLYSSSVMVGSTTPQTATEQLVSGVAVANYVASELSNVDGNYVHIAGTETITGAKTFTESVTISGTGKKLTTPEVSSASYTGTGVYSSYVAGTGTGGWGNSASNAKLPTVQTVRSAIGDTETAITTAYTTADNGLQAQIDALNAGQNLADMVATKAALDALSTTNLQNGDKVQVLADETHDSASTVYTLNKPASGTPSWTYVGKYGQDSYTKSESDGRYVNKNTLNTSAEITTNASTTNAPSTKAVYDYIASLENTIAGAYVKLSSQTTQNITSDLDITGQVDIDNVTIDGFTISAAYVDTSGNPYHYKITTSSPGDTQVSIQQRQGSASSTSTLISSITLDGSGKAVYIDNGEDNIVFHSESINGTTVPDVHGDLVADYSDITPTPAQSVTDGRLVTVDYMLSEIGKATPVGVAYLAQENVFTGNTNTFKGVSATSYTGTGVYSTYSSGTGTGGWDNSASNSKIPTVASVRSAIADSKTDTLETISAENEIGSIGLFMYTEVGAQKSYGDYVNGAYLKPVGMSLPMSGQITYKAVATTNALSGKWKLLSVAMKRTATEPCLVLAQKVAANYST